MFGVDVSVRNKFNGQNYYSFRFQIVCALKAKSVLATAYGTKINTATEEAQIETRWCRNNFYDIFGYGFIANHVH